MSSARITTKLGRGAVASAAGREEHQRRGDEARRDGRLAASTPGILAMAGRVPGAGVERSISRNRVWRRERIFDNVPGQESDPRWAGPASRRVLAAAGANSATLGARGPAARRGRRDHGHRDHQRHRRGRHRRAGRARGRRSHRRPHRGGGRAVERAGRTIDATGKIVAPGFIDAHAHSDFALLRDPLNPEKVMQGVTTNIIGNCALSPAPVDDTVRLFFENLLQHVFGTVKIRWNGLRRAAARLRDRGRGAEPDEPGRTGHDPHGGDGHGEPPRRLPGDAGDAANISRRRWRPAPSASPPGLMYPPGSFAEREELIELTRVVAEYDGMYATHMRNEDDDLLESLEEAIRIGEEAGVPVQISHHKAVGKPNWGKVASPWPGSTPRAAPGSNRLRRLSLHRLQHHSRARCSRRSSGSPRRPCSFRARASTSRWSGGTPTRWPRSAGRPCSSARGRSTRARRAR